MGNNKKCFPAHISKLLEKKGYYNLSSEERVSKHKDTLEKLKGVAHFDYDAGREALKELRGQ